MFKDSRRGRQHVLGARKHTLIASKYNNFYAHPSNSNQICSMSARLLDLHRNTCVSSAYA